MEIDPRVGLEAFLWGRPGSYRQSGVSTYIRHLVQEMGHLDWPRELLVYLPSADVAREIPPRLRPRAAPIDLHRPAVRILWQHSLFPLLLGYDRVNLLHATMNVAPWWTPCAVVVTIHDLAYLRYPAVHPLGRRLYLAALTRLSVQRARAIVAVSRFTRQEILHFFRIPAHRVRVIYEGYDPAFRPLPAAETEAFRKQRNLPRRFFLYVGNLEPRKNLPTLVRAFARIAPHTDAFLVLAGPRGWGYGGLFQLIQELGLGRRVVLPGFVPAEELPLWYNAASALVYPSRYEGFGLPPLEAMACGTPVVVSSASSLPEVVGDAGLQVEPEDVDALSEALMRLLTEPGLVEMCRERGLQQAKRFSWSTMAQETAYLYRELLEQGALQPEP
ncbi:MAG: glycosyltransferase family 4 protein [Chloroflexia bacterium]